MDRLKRLLAVCLLNTVFGLLLGNECRAEDPKDILYYGNSFTFGAGSTRSVPSLINDIAVAAGHVAPRNRDASVSGQSLSGHLSTNTGVITTGIMAGETWEAVVLQDLSTQPTLPPNGNRDLHRSSAVGLYQAVFAHSPNVVPIMFETWARGPGHSFYTVAPIKFPGGPAQMQQELRDGYHLSAQDISSEPGMDAKYAPVGDAWENANWMVTGGKLHHTDLWHAQNRGTLLAALVLYATIYDDPTTSDINLSGVLSSLALTAQDGLDLTGVADATLVPDLPGDYNDDGKVDAADYVVWRKNENSTNTLPNDNGIGGTVGAAHYNLWRANFGNMAMTGSGLGSTSVPEPATVSLGLISVLGMFGRIRRR